MFFQNLLVFFLLIYGQSQFNIVESILASIGLSCFSYFLHHQLTFFSYPFHSIRFHAEWNVSCYHFLFFYSLMSFYCIFIAFSLYIHCLSFWCIFIGFLLVYTHWLSFGVHSLPFFLVYIHCLSFWCISFIYYWSEQHNC